MLTIKQPVHYGYKSVHDLPTPPSTSRPSPPLIFQEPQKPLPAIPRSHSPSNQPMSGHHRGLPPPAAMALSQPPPPGPGSHPPPPPGPGPGQVPPPSSSAVQVQQLGQLPAPPQWQASEESMRAWLLAKAEEEKRRQEELRLEQRRMEHDILRTSLQGGIPPPMVPVVFAGMGGGNLPQAALEWAQQFMYSQAQQNQHPQLLPPTGPVSPHHHRRDSQSQAAYGPYPGSGGVPSTPGSAQGPQGGFVAGYPGSPTRPRGYSLPPGSRPLGGSNLPTLNTNVPSGPGGPSAGHSHPSMASAQQERPSSPPIYFHHWQPPTSQAGQSSSNQPATPSGESPRKRKATGPQQAAPPPSSHQRFRSPPFSQASGSTLSNPPPGRRRGHSRQRSDISSYRPTGRGRSEGFGGPQRGGSPMPGSGPSSAREGNGGSAAEAFSTQPQQQQPPPSLSQTRSGAHSVSSLLSEDPSPHTPQYPRVSSSSDVRAQQAVDSDQRNSPHSSDDRTRGGAAGLAATRERDNE